MWYIEEEDHSDEEAKAFEIEDWHSPGNAVGRSSVHTPTHEHKYDKTEPFSVKVLDATRGISLFGTVPPPRKVSVSMQDTADAVGLQLAEIQPDGVVIYDIQDEPSRSGEERPFPFFQTYYPREYGVLLRNHLQSDTELVIFRALTPGETEEEFGDWAEASINEYKLNNWVIVGGQRTELPMLRVEEASRIMSKTGRNVILGGITLPERHRDKNDEPERITKKVAEGVSFFTSQVVYNVDNVIWFLQDYVAYCAEKNVRPVRIVFTFAPFGSARTVKFMQWLGIEIPVGTQKRVLSKPTTKDRVHESMTICWENWRRILHACQRLNLDVPLGFSVEAVSRSKLEQRGAVTLFKALNELMVAYYESKEEALLDRMMEQDGTYIVQVKNGGARITQLVENEAPREFGIVEPLAKSTESGIRRPKSLASLANSFSSQSSFPS